MKLKKLAGAASAFALATFTAGMITGAGAGVLSVPQPVVAGEAGIQAELAHGCHRGIQRDYSGWHFHTRACQRQNAPPPGLYDGPSYRRFYRGPICSYQCRYIGPVKTCQQVCR